MYLSFLFLPFLHIFFSVGRQSSCMGWRWDVVFSSTVSKLLSLNESSSLLEDVCSTPLSKLLWNTERNPVVCKIFTGIWDSVLGSHPRYARKDSWDSLGKDFQRIYWVQGNFTRLRGEKVIASYCLVKVFLTESAHWQTDGKKKNTSAGPFWIDVKYAFGGRISPQTFNFWDDCQLMKEMCPT